MAVLSVRKVALQLGLKLLLGVLAASHAHGEEIGEYQVKAAFLYNFAKFVEWPPQSFKTPTDPIAICGLGLNRFGDTLEETVRGKTAGGRPFVVRAVSGIPAAGACHILFVSSPEWRRLGSDLGLLKVNGLLTVGETPGFAAGGGVINFKLQDGKVRLEINMEAAEQAHLHLSFKLLSVADIVKKRE